MAIEGVYANPAMRLQAVSQPNAWGGEQKLLIGDLRRPEDLFAPGKSGGAPGSDFGELFSSAVEKANALGHAAEGQADAFAKGAADDLHGSMISAKQAEISLKLVGTVRTKLLDAFHELWRTNV